MRGARLLAKHSIAASVAELRDSDRPTAALLLRQLLASVSANVGVTESRRASSPEPLYIPPPEVKSQTTCIPRASVKPDIEPGYPNPMLRWL